MVVSRLSEVRFIDPNTGIVLSTLGVPYGSSLYFGHGDTVKKGQTVCYVEAMKTFNAIAAECDGTVVEICLTSGASVAEDDVLMKIK